MNIECSVDGKPVLLTVNSNKPLNLILMEEFDPPLMKVHCAGNQCGYCVVFINDTAALSCLIPAFRLKGAQILTFEGYCKTRFWHDIERAYNDTGFQPCPRCLAPRTLILESLLQRIGKPDQAETALDSSVIVRELNLCPCTCLNDVELVAIYNTAANYRRKRRVRRH